MPAGGRAARCAAVAVACEWRCGSCRYSSGFAGRFGAGRVARALSAQSRAGDIDRYQSGAFPVEYAAASCRQGSAVLNKTKHRCEEVVGDSRLAKGMAVVADRDDVFDAVASRSK